MQPIEFIPIPNLPLVKPNDNVANLIFSAAKSAAIHLQRTDIVLIAQKIVSKMENCFVRLNEVTPSAQALELAEITGKPAAQVEVILWDTTEIIRARRDVLIVQHKLGFISANAGIDHSNVSEEEGVLLRLPVDPDASARALRQRLQQISGVAPPVLIIDSHGRPWRFGTVGVTIGLSGLAPVQNLRQQPDLFGDPLEITEVGFADQLAAGASLVMGQAAEGCPVVIARGLDFTPDESARAADVLRPKNMDLFR